MQNDNNKIWFPAKKYGWGWGLPCAWQGWVVYAAWWLSLFSGAFFMAPHHIGLFVIYSIVLGVVLILVVAVKGEKPRWRWGDTKKK
jgi:hypothetical protein